VPVTSNEAVGVSIGVLTAAAVLLGRWVAAVSSRVHELRERVARLEGRADRDDAGRT
jgi:hypothetical protein